MSEISRDMNASAETNMGPDLFQYYIRGVSELLAGDEFLPSSSTPSGAANGSSGEKEAAKEDAVGFSSLFCNAAGDGLSGFGEARLVSMLRQSVVDLTQEVDEMLGPVLSMQRLRGLIAPTKGCVIYQDANRKHEDENRARKRPKVPYSSSAVNKPLIASSLTGEGSPKEPKGVARPGKLVTTCCNRGCANFSKMDKHTHKSNPDESKYLCDDCLKHPKESNGSVLGLSPRDDKENGEVNDDLQVLLVNRGPKVEEKLEKHSAELSSTLGRMQEKLEELLDTVISSFRPMTLAEKLQLRRLIEKLPPKNLDRVVEIMQRGKPCDKRCGDDIIVDLQHQADLTLWRIYFYVKAVKNAQKLLA